MIPSLAAEAFGTENVSNNNNGGVIAGAVVGSVVGAALIFGGIFGLRKRYKNSERKRRHQSELDDEDFYANPYDQAVGYNNTTDPPVAPIHNYVGPQQSISDEYDEYGHISKGSVWSRLSQRLPSLRR